MKNSKEKRRAIAILKHTLKILVKREDYFFTISPESIVFNDCSILENEDIEKVLDSFGLHYESHLNEGMLIRKTYTVAISKESLIS